MNQIKQIDYFLAVVRARSFTKAAETLYVSQSSLSQYISSLEQQIGMPLLLRAGNKPLQLTEAGQIYYTAAAQMEGIRNNAAMQIQLLKTQSRTKISWGHAGKQGLYLLGLLLPLFQDLQINVIQSPVGDLEEMLLSGTLDIACSAIVDMNPAFSYYMWENDYLNAAVSPDHPFFHLGSERAGDSPEAISLQSFSDSSFVLQRGDTTIRKEIDRLFATAACIPHIKMEVKSTFHALSVLSGNKQVAIVPDGYTFPNIRFIRLIERQNYPVYVYCRKDAMQNTALQQIFSEVKRLFPDPEERSR